MCCLDYLSVKHSLSKDMSILLIAANLNRQIEKHKLAKIGPDMEAETVIYFYFIFFFSKQRYQEFNQLRITFTLDSD